MKKLGNFGIISNSKLILDNNINLAKLNKKRSKIKESHSQSPKTMEVSKRDSLVEHL